MPVATPKNEPEKKPIPKPQSRDAPKQEASPGGAVESPAERDEDSDGSSWELRPPSDS